MFVLARRGCSLQLLLLGWQKEKARFKDEWKLPKWIARVVDWVKVRWWWLGSSGADVSSIHWLRLWRVTSNSTLPSAWMHQGVVDHSGGGLVLRWFESVRGSCFCRAAIFQ